VLTRRAFLAAAGATLVTVEPRVASCRTPESDELQQHDLRLDGDPKLARRALVLVPKHVPTCARLPLLVLLHGLGETGNELLGIHAWGDLYGLVRCYERLRRPPVVRTRPGRPFLSEQRLSELNGSLERKPLQGLVIACPVTPNPHRSGPAAQVLDEYAEWIHGALLPAVRRVAPLVDGAEGRGLDGCSLGGYVAIELMLRRPELFGTFGTVQGAYSAPRAVQYARALARVLQRVGPRPIHIESSSQDPYREANEAMSRELGRLGVPHELCVPVGPHSQPWLREVGTLEMLLWHDRQLQRS
jgi:predicted esterase